MKISTIWRFPVKSMQGEMLSSASVTEHGIAGDRGWGLVDVATEKTLTARREPNLLFARAAVIDGQVRVTLPAGEHTTGDAAADNALLSAWVGRPVELRKATEESTGSFETQADETETGDWFTWTGRTGSFHDSSKSPISLVSKTSLRDWDPRRFRINVILDGSGEDDLVGKDIGIGGAQLRVMKQIDRCVMVTRPQPSLTDQGELGRDLSVLKTINAERESFLGIGCLIPGAGEIAIGDELQVR